MFRTPLSRRIPRLRCAALVVPLAWLAGCVAPAPPTALPPIARPATPPDADALTLYVSPTGNDAWSGGLPIPTQARTDGPLATLAAARDRIRAIKAAAGGLKRPVTVLLRGGVYRQSKALVFTAADSGTEACPITYQAYPGEYPVLSGGAVVSGWQRDRSEHSKTRCGGRLWRVQLPADGGEHWRFNQLFVNGQRRTRARTPNRGAFLRTDGPIAKNDARGFYFKEGDIREWDRLRDAIVVAYHSWETSIHHIRSVDTQACQVRFREPAPWPMGRWEKQQRYYVENIFEALDEPGEWYLERTTKTLYYYPLPGEKMTHVEVVAPVVTSTLVNFDGHPADNEFVEYLRFRGVSFQHSNSNLSRLRNPGQGEIYQPAMLMAIGLRHSVFEACEVAHTGAHAIWLAAGCSDTRIERCHLHDLGGGGVYIGGGWGVHDGTPAARITVDDSFIHDGGYMFHGAHGVWIGKSSYNTITHNEISNFDYSGISCGWSWGFQPSSANHNTLDFNHIHHLSNGEGLSDMGAIYTLGISPGTTERHNLMHDVYSYAHVSHGSGVYPDEGSSEILVENNVVYRVRTCPLFQHYGKDNIIRNNILAFGGKGQLQRCREDKPCHYRAEGNIVYADIREMLGGVWRNGDWQLGHNLYWSTAGEPTFKGMDFAAWQKFANDTGSMVADPLFLDAEHGDFRLRPDSPALKLGFKPIDTTQAGLYGDPEWVALPARYPNRQLNEVPAPVEPPFVVNFDFEAEAANAEPLDGKVVAGGSGASLAVSADTAVSGQHSLKFVDAPGQKFSWTPHLYYRPSYETGEILLSWDMCNSREQPASFYVELRQWDVDPYRVGPTISVAPDGTVTASDRKVGTIPLGEWVHVAIRLTLGEGGSPNYHLSFGAPGKEPTVVDIPYRDATFEKITWLGISSTTEATSVFYIDNLKLGTAEQLAQAPKRRPHARAAARRAGQPMNAERLAAYWPFDESDGYIAEDRSGCANDGDMWATWAKGSFGTAIFCDVAAAAVDVPDDPTLRFGTSDFSIELWLCPTKLAINDGDPRRRFMSKDHYPKTWWNMNITTEGTPFLEMKDSTGGSCSNRPDGTIPEGAWTHLAVVVDRTHGKTRYYFNGALDSEQNIPESFSGSLDVKGGDLSIGSKWHPFIGLLDEVKLYQRALTAAEIKASYDREKPHRTSAEYQLVE